MDDGEFYHSPTHRFVLALWEWIHLEFASCCKNCPTLRLKQRCLLLMILPTFSTFQGSRSFRICFMTSFFPQRQWFHPFLLVCVCVSVKFLFPLRTKPCMTVARVTMTRTHLISDWLYDKNKTSRCG